MNRGNLAVRETYRKPDASAQIDEQKKGGLKLVPQRKIESRRYIQEKAQYQSRALFRAKRTAQVLLCILALTAMLAVVLTNQTKVIELSFANSELQNKIAKAQINNIQKQSEIIKLTDLDSIRSRAILMGFQEPGPDQIIYLSVPKQDKLIVKSDVAAENENEIPAQDEAVYKNLEGFFRTLQP